MQFVDRQTFLSLGGISESETTGDVRRSIETAKKLGQEMKGRRIDPAMFQDWVEEHGKDVRLVGLGSSRAVVEVGNGVCLKMIRFPDMAEQQMHEVKNCVKARKMKLNCFPEVTAWDEHGWSWLTTWLCTQADESDFRRLTGHSLPYLIAGTSMLAMSARRAGGLRRALPVALQTVENFDEFMLDPENEGSPEFELFDTLEYWTRTDPGGKFDIDSYIRVNTDGTFGYDDESPSDMDELVQVMTKIDEPDGDVWRQFRQLARFAATSKNALFALRDCWTPGNWGLALVNGRQLPMVVDSGYCPELEGEA